MTSRNITACGKHFHASVVAVDLLSSMVSLTTVGLLSHKKTNAFYQPLILGAGVLLATASSVSSGMRSICSANENLSLFSKHGEQTILFASYFILGFQLDIQYAVALSFFVAGLNLLSRAFVFASTNKDANGAFPVYQILAWGKSHNLTGTIIYLDL